jgi:hypothetical protein
MVHLREERIHADIGQCFNALGSKHSAEWIFEGDITTAAGSSDVVSGGMFVSPMVRGGEPRNSCNSLMTETA